jgi:hypothetical protein
MLLVVFYVCGTSSLSLSLSLRVENEYEDFEKRALRKTFGPKIETGSHRRLDNTAQSDG